MQQRLQKVQEIVSSPEYQGKDIHLEDDNYLGSSYDIYTYEEEGASDTKPIKVFLGTLTSTRDCQNQEVALHGLNSISDKIHAKVRVNELHDTSLKVDTGAITSVITMTDLQLFPFPITILPGTRGFHDRKHWCSHTEILLQRQIDKRQVQHSRSPRKPIYAGVSPVPRTGNNNSKHG